MKIRARDNNGFAVGDSIFVLVGWDVFKAIIKEGLIQGQYTVELSSGRTMFVQPQHMKHSYIARQELF